jgi:hypothetical protein
LDESLSDENEEKSPDEWLQYGAEHEDDTDNLTGFPDRSNNHFHNPQKSWSEAGLSDIASGRSSIIWAQDGLLQASISTEQGDCSWDKAREFYHKALIEAEYPVWRKNYFADMFKILGHQIHLIQDLAVPDHVRNDTHVLNSFPFGWGLWKKKMNSFRCIEGWAGASHNEEEINKILAGEIPTPSIELSLTVDPAAPVPIALLSDTKQYKIRQTPSAGLDQGLAEYTNANYFSEDTVFTEDYKIDHKHWFPHPCKSETNVMLLNMPSQVIAKDGKIDWIKPVKKSNGEKLENLVAAGYFSSYVGHGEHAYKSTFFLSDECHKEYARKLIPRAVGYSAALLDYFFRGEIEISLPVSNLGINPPQKEGIYSLCTDPAVGFDKISLMVRNITANNEEMTNGSISLVLSYRTCVGNPFSPDRHALEEEKKIISVNHQGKVSIPRDVPLRFNFDLLETPLPYNAMDVTLSVVFRGNLGAELNNAVAVGFKDIGEPTPVDLFNNTDLVCFHGSYVPYTYPALLQEVDINQNGEIDCDLHEITIIPSEITPQYLSFNGRNADERNYYYQYSEITPAIQPGQSLRFYYLTDDYPVASHFSIHVDSKFISTPAIQINGSCQPFHTDDVNNGYSYVNKLQWEPTAEDYLHIKSSIHNYRGLDYFHIIRYQNITVPLGSRCTQNSVAVIEDEVALTDEEKMQNRLQPGIADINQRSGKVRK